MAKKQFEAESKRLLDLMINSIYTNKEIFLRELISNASDAIDKMCYLALTDSSVGLSRSDFSIDIQVDSIKRLLTVSDNGIGMNDEELESNLGVIAQSGSLQFKKDIDKAQMDDIEIIGQFGVGFYSAFMVSDKITVLSRKFGDDQGWKWESSGADGYTIAPAKKDTPGTEITMKIKKDADEEDYSRFLSEYSLSSLIKKYSDYIRYPIKMEMEKQRNKNEGIEGKEPKWETYREVETLNSMVPIWQRKKSEVTDEELNSYYKENFYAMDDPLKTIRVEAEGVVNYKALLFIPAKASYDYYTKEYKKGLQLYSSGVMIMDRCEELIPEYFRFVRGVVDSPDLSLNISREMLQQTRQLKTIAANIEKKVLSELQTMLDKDRDTYTSFWNAFGPQIKYGTMEDYGMHKDKLQDLLLFHSSAGDSLTSLKEYVGRMKDGQKSIYYASGENIKQISALPQAEYIRDKGYEILYFVEEVDEFLAQMLMTYDEKPLKSINEDDPDLDTGDDNIEKQAEENKGLMEFIQETLKDKIKEAKLSRKLRSQPVCLVSGGSLSFEMEKYLNQVQPEGNHKADRILEFNADHPLFHKLNELMETDKAMAEKYVKILYGQAQLMAGLDIEDPAEYSETLFEIM